MRSDTVTRPSPAMLEAMVNAEVGDDGFADDPTLAQLEQKIADLLGKETAMFVPSGTMSNQMAIALHTQPGDLVLCHGRSHIFSHEFGGAAAISGVTLMPFDDGSPLPPDALIDETLGLVERGRSAPFGLLCLENTHNDCGGVVLDQARVLDLAGRLTPAGVPLHLDGARLFNAATSAGVSVKELAEPFETVSVCMSKGLGAPAGSLLAMPARFRPRARRVRRYLGGMMRQTGVFAAAALYALENHVDGLADDHRRARQLGAILAALPGVEVVSPHSNLVWFRLREGHPLYGKLEDGLVDRLKAEGVWLTGDGALFRAVTHRDITDGHLERAVRALQRLLSAD